MSWKKSRERAAKLEMKWASAWDKFNAFLLDMGPKPTPKHTLDRTNPHVKAYGPGLCKWKTPPEQNNNKTTNLKIWDPLGKAFLSSHDAAEIAGVPLTTIHKLNAAGVSSFEMLMGKKDPRLALIAATFPDFFKPPALKVAIKDLPPDTPAPPAALRLPLTFLKYHKAPDLDCDDPCDYVLDEDTGKEIAGPLCAAFLEQGRRFKALRAWYDAWNAGEPCTLYPPVKTSLTADMTPYVLVVAGKQWNPATPPQLAVKPVAPAPAEPEEDDDDDDEQNEESFYATACDEDFNEEAP